MIELLSFLNINSFLVIYNKYPQGKGAQILIIPAKILFYSGGLELEFSFGR